MFVNVPVLLEHIGLASSRGDARRLIDAGAVEVMGEGIAPKEHRFMEVFPPESVVFRVGKRRFARMNFVSQRGTRADGTNAKG